MQSYLQERLGREDADLTCSVNSVNDTNLVNISVQADTRRDAWFGLQYMLEGYRTNGDKYHFTYDLNVTQTNPISEAPISANSHSRNLMMGGIGGELEKMGLATRTPATLLSNEGFAPVKGALDGVIDLVRPELLEEGEVTADIAALVILIGRAQWRGRV